MKIGVTTIFPSLFQGLLSEGIVARALNKGLLTVDVVNLRDFVTDSYRTVDDYPYGGGPGMIMKPEPILKAVGSLTGIDYLKERSSEALAHGLDKTGAEKPSAVSCAVRPAQSGTRIVILSPQGRKYDQNLAAELSACNSVILICGRYKAIDERVGEILDAEEISIGDYVLSGGELPAMVIIESIVRLLPGAMEDEDSAAGDSFVDGILDCAYYTRPEVVAGKKVPDLLLSGNHEEIRKWRIRNRLSRTLERRSDLLEKAVLSEEYRKLLKESARET